MKDYPTDLHPEITDEQLQQTIADTAAAVEAHHSLERGWRILADVDDPQVRTLRRFLAGQSSADAAKLETRLDVFKRMGEARAEWRQMAGERFNAEFKRRLLDGETVADLLQEGDTVWFDDSLYRYKGGTFVREMTAAEFLSASTSHTPVNAPLFTISVPSQ